MADRMLFAVWRIRDVFFRIPGPDFYPSRIPDLGTIVIYLSNICVWDPGSRKNLFRIRDPDPQLLYCYTHSYTQPEDLKNRKPNKQGYGSEMETVRIRDPRWRQFGSRIQDGDSSDPG
jgi:hypothetical protein